MEFNPQAMQQLGQLPLMFSAQGYDWMNRAKQNDAQTLAETQLQRQRDAEAHRSSQAQAGATLEGTMLTNAQRAQANAQAKKMDPLLIEDKLLSISKSKSDQEWDGIVQGINKAMMSSDERVSGQAKQLYERLPAVMEKRKLAAAAAEEAKIKDATARRGQDVSAASARYTADKSLERASAGGAKPPTSPNALYARYQFQADNAEDPAEREQYRLLAERELERIVQARIAGRPDISALTQGAIPVNPMPTSGGGIPDPLRDRAVQRPSAAPAGRVMVVSPDGKVGHIPKEQLQDALSKGYKQQ